MAFAVGCFQTMGFSLSTRPNGSHSTSETLSAFMRSTSICHNHIPHSPVLRTLQSRPLLYLNPSEKVGQGTTVHYGVPHHEPYCARDSNAYPIQSKKKDRVLYVFRRQPYALPLALVRAGLT